MPFSNTSRCSGSASTDCTMCRSCTRAGSTLRQRLGQEVGLLLVVAFEADAVAGLDHGLEQRDDVVRRNDLCTGIAERGPRAHQAHAQALDLVVPAADGVRRCVHVYNASTYVCKIAPNDGHMQAECARIMV